VTVVIFLAKEASRFHSLGFNLEDRRLGRMAISEVLCREFTDQTFLQMTCELD
jgi:hypothetical protein